jgi:hypothetical protein
LIAYCAWPDWATGLFSYKAEIFRPRMRFKAILGQLGCCFQNFLHQIMLQPNKNKRSQLLKE